MHKQTQQAFSCTHASFINMKGVYFIDSVNARGGVIRKTPPDLLLARACLEFSIDKHG